MILMCNFHSSKVLKNNQISILSLYKAAFYLIKEKGG